MNHRLRNRLPMTFPHPSSHLPWKFCWRNDFEPAPCELFFVHWEVTEYNSSFPLSYSRNLPAYHSNHRYPWSASNMSSRRKVKNAQQTTNRCTCLMHSHAQTNLLMQDDAGTCTNKSLVSLYIFSKTVRNIIYHWTVQSSCKSRKRHLIFSYRDVLWGILGVEWPQILESIYQHISDTPGPDSGPCLYAL